MLDLTSAAVLTALGLSPNSIADPDYTDCQHVGGAVEYFGHDGLLVPNVRSTGATNLVIYPNQQESNYEFRVVSTEVIFEPEKR